MESPPKTQQTKPPMFALKSKCNPEACVPSAASPDKARKAQTQRLGASSSAWGWQQGPRPAGAAGAAPGPGHAPRGSDRRGCSSAFASPPAPAPSLPALRAGHPPPSPSPPSWAAGRPRWAPSRPIPGAAPPSAAQPQRRWAPSRGGSHTDTAGAGAVPVPGQRDARASAAKEEQPRPTRAQPAQDFTLKRDVMRPQPRRAGPWGNPDQSTFTPTGTRSQFIIDLLMV